MIRSGTTLLLLVGSAAAPFAPALESTLHGVPDQSMDREKFTQWIMENLTIQNTGNEPVQVTPLVVLAPAEDIARALDREMRRIDEMVGMPVDSLDNFTKAAVDSLDNFRLAPGEGWEPGDSWLRGVSWDVDSMWPEGMMWSFPGRQNEILKGTETTAPAARLPHMVQEAVNRAVGESKEGSTPYILVAGLYPTGPGARDREQIRPMLLALSPDEPVKR